MMKNLFLMALTVLATSAVMATPAVGDRVVYDLQGSVNGTSFAGTIIGEITEILTSGEVKVKSTANVEGRVQIKESVLANNELPTDDQIAAILGACEANGGKSESLSVPAGVFPTCKFSSTQDDRITVTWVGAVPFGLIKSETTTTKGDSQVLALKESKRGN